MHKRISESNSPSTSASGTRLTERAGARCSYFCAEWPVVDEWSCSQSFTILTAVCARRSQERTFKFAMNCRPQRQLKRSMSGRPAVPVKAQSCHSPSTSDSVSSGSPAPIGPAYDSAHDHSLGGRESHATRSESTPDLCDDRSSQTGDINVALADA